MQRVTTNGVDWVVCWNWAISCNLPEISQFNNQINGCKLATQIHVLDERKKNNWKYVSWKWVVKNCDENKKKQTDPNEGIEPKEFI